MVNHLATAILLLGRKREDGLVEPLGTSFIVGERKFATAAHVVGPSDAGLVAIISRIGQIADYQDTTDSRVSYMPVSLAAYDPVRDIAILEAPSDVRLAVPYLAVGSDEAPPGTAVTSLGFPHADTGRVVLTQHSSVVGARVLLGSGGARTKHLVLNTQTRPGQSGGPVLSADGSKLFAMIVGGYTPVGVAGGVSIGGIDPQTLHQTTHAVSAEYISGMI